MKSLLKVLGMVMLITVLFTCAQDELSDLNVADEASEQELKCAVPEVAPAEFYCNWEPVVLDLTTREDVRVGTVTLVNDETNIYVTYELEDGAMLDRLITYVGDKEGIPLNNRGVPIPLRFPYKVWSIKGNSFTFTVPLEGISDPCPAVLAFAVLNDGQAAWAWDGEEEALFANLYNTRRWGYQNEYCIADCAENYFTLKFFVERPDGSKYWSIMEGPEQFYFQDDWCDQMAVVKLTEDISLPAMRGDKSIGMVNLTLEDDNIRVDIVPDNLDCKVYKSYAFYGSLHDLSEYGSCPKYYNFPNAFEGDEASEFVIPLE